MANLLATLLGLLGGSRKNPGNALVSGEHPDVQAATETQAALDDGPRAPGWFGKLPALGDFASRRLPDAFVTQWDTWLADGMQAGADALGETWSATFANARAWRFLLAPGVIDGNAWIGVVQPSEDKVGRAFPLTLALPLRARATPAGALAAWLDAATQAARTCRDPDSTLEQWDTQLAALGEPAFIETVAADDGVIAHWPAGAALEASFGAALPWLLGELRGTTFWWPGGEGADAAITVVRGLPSPAGFAKMIAG